MEVVGVVKDKEPKTEEIDVSHTLGGVGECLLQGRGKWRGCTSYSVGVYVRERSVDMYIMYTN